MPKNIPKPVKTSAPWYCPRCLAHSESAFEDARDP